MICSVAPLQRGLLFPFHQPTAHAGGLNNLALRAGNGENFRLCEGALDKSDCISEVWSRLTALRLPTFRPFRINPILDQCTISQLIRSQQRANIALRLS